MVVWHPDSQQGPRVQCADNLLPAASPWGIRKEGWSWAWGSKWVEQPLGSGWSLEAGFVHLGQQGRREGM